MALQYLYSEMSDKFNLSKFPQDEDGWSKISDDEIVKIIEKNIKENIKEKK